MRPNYVSSPRGIQEPLRRITLATASNYKVFSSAIRCGPDALWHPALPSDAFLALSHPSAYFPALSPAARRTRSFSVSQTSSICSSSIRLKNGNAKVRSACHSVTGRPALAQGADR